MRPNSKPAGVKKERKRKGGADLTEGDEADDAAEGGGVAKLEDVTSKDEELVESTSQRLVFMAHTLAKLKVCPVPSSSSPSPSS